MKTAALNLVDVPCQMLVFHSWHQLWASRGCCCCCCSSAGHKVKYLLMGTWQVAAAAIACDCDCDCVIWPGAISYAIVCTSKSANCTTAPPMGGSLNCWVWESRLVSAVCQSERKTAFPLPFSFLLKLKVLRDTGSAAFWHIWRA